MIQPLENMFKRAARLSEAGQRIALKEFKKILARIESEEKKKQEENTPFVSAYDLIKHAAGSLEGPGDMSTNSQYLDDLGKSSIS